MVSHHSIDTARRIDVLKKSFSKFYQATASQLPQSTLAINVKKSFPAYRQWSKTFLFVVVLFCLHSTDSVDWAASDL